MWCQGSFALLQCFKKWEHFDLFFHASFNFLHTVNSILRTPAAQAPAIIIQKAKFLKAKPVKYLNLLLITFLQFWYTILHHIFTIPFFILIALLLEFLETPLIYIKVSCVSILSLKTLGTSSKNKCENTSFLLSPSSPYSVPNKSSTV